MRRYKVLVLSTFAFFCAALACLGIHYSVHSQRMIRIDSTHYPSIGNQDAEVEVIVIEDLMCHLCRYFTLEVFPAIQSNYIAPGIAKYVMIPVAFLPHSHEVANAALDIYAHTPQFFFPFVRAYFLRLSDKTMDLEALVALAQEFEGIDIASLEQSVKEGRYNQQLDENLQVAANAMKKNVRTPAVFINGVLSPGISFDSISRQIEQKEIQ